MFEPGSGSTTESNHPKAIDKIKQILSVELVETVESIKRVNRIWP